MYCFKCGAQFNEGTPVCPVCNQIQPQLQNFPPQYVVLKPKIPGRGKGIAGMVLGIIGLVYCLPILSAAISFINSDFLSDAMKVSLIPSFLMISTLSILAVSLAGAGRLKGYRNGVSASGVIMGAIGLTIQTASILIALIS